MITLNGDKPKTLRKHIVQSLDRGLKGLDLAFEGGVKPSELARALGVERSSAYRLLYTLAYRGYLVYDGRRRIFVPNAAKFAGMNARLEQSNDWSHQARASLIVLRDKTGETANVGMLDGRHVVFLGQELSQSSVIIINLLGRRRPAHCSALGKAILAYQPRAVLEQWVAAQPLDALTPRSITDPEALLKHLATVRQLGYAVDDEETNEGVRCVAAPLLASSGRVLGSLGISGPNSRLPLSRLPEVAQVVCEVAQATPLNHWQDLAAPGSG